MSRFQRFGICRQVPGALPRAVALRTFVLINTPARYIDESSMSLPFKRFLHVF